jgi:hypothetical protein
MIKFTINRRTNVVTMYKNIRKTSACVEKIGIILGGRWLFAVWEGRVGMWKKNEK